MKRRGEAARARSSAQQRSSDARGDRDSRDVRRVKSAKSVQLARAVWSVVLSLSTWRERDGRGCSIARENRATAAALTRLAKRGTFRSVVQSIRSVDRSNNLCRIECAERGRREGFEGRALDSALYIGEVVRQVRGENAASPMVLWLLMHGTTARAPVSLSVAGPRFRPVDRRVGLGKRRIEVAQRGPRAGSQKRATAPVEPHSLQWSYSELAEALAGEQVEVVFVQSCEGGAFELLDALASCSAAKRVVASPVRLPPPDSTCAKWLGCFSDGPTPSLVARSIVERAPGGARYFVANLEHFESLRSSLRRLFSGLTRHTESDCACSTRAREWLREVERAADPSTGRVEILNLVGAADRLLFELADELTSARIALTRVFEAGSSASMDVSASFPLDAPIAAATRLVFEDIGWYPLLRRLGRCVGKEPQLSSKGDT